jgi:hypothetical protein
MNPPTLGSAAGTAVAALLLFGGGATPAFAQCSDTWAGGSGGDWSVAANWSSGEPGPSSNTCIGTAGANVTVDTTAQTFGLALGSGDTLTIPNNYSYNLTAGGPIVNGGQILLSGGTSGSILYILSGSTVTLSGPGSLVMQTGANITGDVPNTNSWLVNQSTIEGVGAIDNAIILNNSGRVNANQTGGQLAVGRFGTVSGTNTGTMEATNGGQLFFGSTIFSNVGGTIRAVGTGSSAVLGFLGAGGLTMTGGTYTTSSGGVIYAQQGALIDGTGANTVTNSGTMILSDTGGNAGASFQGAFSNTGTLQVLSTGDGVTLKVPSGQTLTYSGGGKLIMGDGTSNSYNNLLAISGGGTLVNQSIIQGTGEIGNSLLGIANSGMIDANVPTGASGLQLFLYRMGTGGITNTGTLEATNGGVLSLASDQVANNGGAIAAVGANSQVLLEGALTISGGTLTTSGGGAIYGWDNSLLDGTTDAITNSGSLILNIPGPGNTPDASVQGTLINSGSIRILSSSACCGPYLTIPNGETFTLTGSGKVTMGDGTNNSYNNNPTIGSQLGTNGTFVNQSTVQGTGIIGYIGSIANSGTINANVPVGANGLQLTLGPASGPITNSGTLEATNGGELSFYYSTGFTNTGALTVAAGSTLSLANTNDFTNLVNGTLTGGAYNVTGTLQMPGKITTNAAKITLIGTSSQILNPTTNALAGFATNAAAGSFTLAGDQDFTTAGAFTNQGLMTISTGSTFTLGAGGAYVQSAGKTTVNGTLAFVSGTGSVAIERGSVFGDGTLEASVKSSGSVTPGASATTTGTLTVSGAYVQTSAGSLNANIAGTSPGTEYSQLNGEAGASLSGTLNIALLNGFVPAVGSTFEILKCTGLKGTFTTVNGAAIDSNEHFTVQYNSNNVTLLVVSGE